MNNKIEGKRTDHLILDEDSSIEEHETNTSNIRHIASDSNNHIFMRDSDNLGELSKYDIEAGNICIIGTDEDAFNLSCYIMSYFARYNRHFELVALEQFLRAGRSANFNNQNYLVHIDLSQVLGNRVGALTDHCSATFIAHISSRGSVDSRVKYNRIISSLGERASKRRNMFDSLRSGEFLVINKDDEMIFCLSDGDLENE